MGKSEVEIPCMSLTAAHTGSVGQEENVTGVLPQYL